MAFDEHKLIFVILTTTTTKIREFYVKSFSTTKSDKFSMKAQHMHSYSTFGSVFLCILFFTFFL